MALQKYTMVFPDAAGGPGRRKAFKAVSVSDAFLQTRNASLEHEVELWKGHSRICRLMPGG
ncbi:MULTISPECIES: hypothetical protein [Novosphingobium]|uniref:Uncharacterized protein n=2 Tax=Novosphingobium TaxID=165696 RepID=A0ABT0AAX9_9SPHN|nr:MULTISPECIES: hypothetical protein [Novosphingobium]MCJ1960334.1 hypothetical protein [Novosphingobium mangrovi (ex Hu et al. 2023)]QVM84423.1 hypothetical protein HT578_12635 [Novosphingobium decolorationis]